jgi:hypothetical protein
MDEDFEYFLKKMGPAVDQRDVPPSSLERYCGKLPNQLLAYWQEHGWCGYANGLFWTVNPQEYDSALEAWIGETKFMEEDAYHVVARTAFGHMLCYGERLGFALKIFAPGSYAVPRNADTSPETRDFDVRCFFAFQKRKPYDFSDLFTPALKKLGPLKRDEMYGFVPALALGGPATLEHLQKVKAVEHLILLAQLSELRVMEVPNT